MGRPSEKVPNRPQWKIRGALTGSYFRKLMMMRWSPASNLLVRDAVEPGKRAIDAQDFIGRFGPLGFAELVVDPDGQGRLDPLVIFGVEADAEASRRHTFVAIGGSLRNAAPTRAESLDIEAKVPIITSFWARVSGSA